jgi:flagellar biogenesis protein FliO
MPVAPAWAQAAAPPPLGVAGARVLGAASVVGLLLALTLLGLRWLFRRVDRSTDTARLRRVLSGRMSWFSRWAPAATAAADRLAILDRSYVGPKESMCVVQVGGERFLIGVTASRISLLGRLETARETMEAGGEETGEPAVADFARELSGATVARPIPTDASVRSLLARSHERLARLGVNSVHAGGRRA